MKRLAILWCGLALGCGELDETTDDATEENVASATEEVVITRYIPIRFMHMMECQSGSLCLDFANNLNLQRAVNRLNETFASAGIAFWIKSNEYIYAPTFAQRDTTTVTNWPMVWEELQRAYPSITSSSYPYHQLMTPEHWMGAVSAYYGDPDAVQFFLFTKGTDPENSAWFPENGRGLLLPADNMWDVAANEPYVYLAHEMGHYFGLRHTWNGMPGVSHDPETGAPWTHADLWDLVYCENTSEDPVFYASKSAANTCAGSLRLIDEGDENTCRATPNPFGPLVCIIDGNLYQAGGDELKGLSIADDNPSDSWNYKVNPMGYWADKPAEWNVDYGTPTFLSASQIRLVKKFANFDHEYHHTDWQRADGGHPGGSLGAPAQTSMRSLLGTATADFIWWGNSRPFTFTSKNRDIGGTTYQPISGDFDNDGRDDILWYNAIDKTARFAWGKSDKTFNADDRVNFFPLLGFQTFAGDFNGDGRSDILAYKPGGPDYIYWAAGFHTFTQQAIVVDGTFRVLIGNFDNQLGDDIFWYDDSNGNIYRWYSNGANGFTNMGWYFADSGGPFVPVVGNFDGVSGDDILWYKPGSGGESLWYSVGTTGFDKRSATASAYGTYTPIVGDFDNDGRDDIFWEKSGAIDDYLWTGEADRNVKFNTQQLMSVYGTFLPVAGDFDGDGFADIYWYRD